MFIISRKTFKIGGNFRSGIVFNIKSSNMKYIAQYSVKCAPNFKSAKIIRKEFIDYYTNKLNHIFIPSSPVIPLCDASLAFVNAGMNQFKSIFLGHHKPPSSKVVNYQKCIRVGGKHNDISSVGLDTYHHTFFEMLGNWSFGAYGKEEACKYAWNTLTQLYGIDKNKLYVTYFGGDELLGIKADLECREIWQKIGIPNDRILPCVMADNFWEMGANGPCGPCTEIHIDRPIHPADNNLKNNLHLTELWNIVFIEFERLADGEIQPLNKQFIDTGMGFERLVTIIQGKNSNYDTDLFQPLFEAIHKSTNAPIYTGKFASNNEHLIDTDYRIMADHSRMITIALADGMIPESNHKLRRIIRKAINIGIETFQSNNLLHELSYHVAESLGDVYPEIQTNLKQIQTIINYEVEHLLNLKASSGKQWQNLIETKPQLAAISDPYAAGLIHSYEILQSTLLNNPNLKTLPGDVAFKIYDTHGLDLEAIEELAQTEGLAVDKFGFNKCLKTAQTRSRIGITRLGKDDDTELFINYLKNNNVPKTNDSYKYNYDYDGVKYRLPLLKCKLLEVLIDGDKENINNKLNRETLKDGKAAILLDKTSFYSQEGGQLSDKGIIYINNLIFNVTEVHKIQDYVIHYGVFDTSSMKNDQADIELHTGDEVTVTIDEEYRSDLMRNHTATHLLNAALRNIFPVVAQRGSVVKNDNLTFKFSTFGKEIRPSDLISIEKQINNCIQSKIPIETKTVNMLELMSEKNLTIIPDEIYPDSNLRIVQVNGPELKSKEACCGTHVHNTGVLEQFSIVEVKSQGLSSKTIVAVTNKHAINEISKKTANNVINNGISQVCAGDVKDINERKKIVLNFLTSEIDNVINSTVEPYIVHCFKCHDVEVESIPLQIAIENCNDMPIFLIAISNRKFKARCFVPMNYLSNSFNAQLWMETLKNVMPIKLGFFKDEDPLINCHSKVLKLPRDEILSLTKNAIAEAKQFVSINAKQLISKNN
ncbi:hypothetical protein PV328_005388 [Microctonus aethiopoides]|uniref:Alanine--tRNA ligase n=1 Tax=Microctonus aethiopoides TaxID=144406 RepID=A0AA39FM87_9HYME|nr:hypothetical protein PV328_005388 [Microctonus aethiopoides]